MCKVYNRVGSLTAIKSHLREQNVNEYRSVNELINFQKNYATVRQQIISDHRLLIEQERIVLIDQIAELDNAIKTKRTEVEQQLLSEQEKLVRQIESFRSTDIHVIQRFINYYKKKALKLELVNNVRTFDLNVAQSLEHLTRNYGLKKDRYQYIASHFDDAVMESSSWQLNQLDRKKKVIDQINASIYGAGGEQKVVRELEKLSDDYILINDFSVEFQRAIYNKQNEDYIKSIQIDHVLLSTSGIFIIETKNWSQQSMKDLSLYSPVQQIKRTNFALYRLINGEDFNYRLNVSKHHWGDRKIPMRNLIVLINHKPIEEFKHVKVLTLRDLISYISYFPPCLSLADVKEIADFLLFINRK